MATAPDDRKARLVERLEQGRESFLAAVAALDEADLAAPVWTDGGHWNARELIGHVAYAEASMLSLIVATIEGDPPRPDADFDLDRFNAGRVRRANDQTLPELLERLAKSRQETLRRLDQATAADLDRASYHPVVKETTVEGIFRVIGFHERMHAKDLRALHQRAGRD